MSFLQQTDPEVYAAIQSETGRLQSNLELIASENVVSEAVLEAQGSVMTNKYAEGYPGKRYYGGCEFVDIVEDLAISRAKQLFGADHVNVQPHSGSQANMAVYFSRLQPGDTILEINNTRVFVNESSAQYLNGMIVDWISSMQESRFVFQNPNETGNCGCGKSFSVDTASSQQSSGQ